MVITADTNSHENYYGYLSLIIGMVTLYRMIQLQDCTKDRLIDQVFMETTISSILEPGTRSDLHDSR